MYAPAPEVPREEVDWPDMLGPFVSYNFQELVWVRKSALTGLTNESCAGSQRANDAIADKYVNLRPSRHWPSPPRQHNNNNLMEGESSWKAQKHVSFRFVVYSDLLLKVVSSWSLFS